MRILLFAVLILAGCQKNIQSATQENIQPATQEDKPSLTLGKTTSTSSSFDVQGHRGARGLMPENTIPGFSKALDLDVTTLEMDTQISKDQQVVISHDPFFIPEITLTPQGNPITVADEKNLVLYNMNYALIKTYDVGSKYYPQFPQQAKFKTYKPLLKDVIDSAEIHALLIGRLKPLLYNIEIKSSITSDGKYYASLPIYVDQVMAVIFGKHITSRVTIQSFDVRALQYMHKRYPSVRLSLDASSRDSLQLSTRLVRLGFTPDIFSINIDAVTSHLIADCAARGIKLVPYVANRLVDMRLAKSLGVNGFMTDYPDLAKQL